MTPFDFTGRTAVVCGASRGIGRAIALAFARAGAAVSICARGADGVQRAAAELAQHGGRVHAQPCDLADGAAVTAYVEAAAAALGGIDVLVNNASGFGAGDSDADWQAGFDVDVMAAVRASRAARPHLARARGAVLHIASIAGIRASRMPSYGAVKAALMHYTGSQARVFAADGIRVNCIAPGSIEFAGGFWDRARRDDPALYADVLARVPFARYGTPDEVADVALFLCSPVARWVTGQVIAVDGGQSLT